jgi:hypothetical protein
VNYCKQNYGKFNPGNAVAKQLLDFFNPPQHPPKAAKK